MLIDFFYSLRAAKLPVSVKELLTLLECLQADVVAANLAPTALSALFIRQANDGQFSPIHLFVPMTLHGAWKAISTARRGDIAAHKKGLIGFYLGALTIPGLFAFMPGRLMATWLFG